MIRLGSVLTLLVAAVLVFQSCNKKKDDVHCPFLAPDMIFVGFSETDRDTMIIRRYEKNSQFNSLIDTFLVSKANIIETKTGLDSVRMRPKNYDVMNNSFYLNDWEIFLPSLNRTIKITDVTPRFTSQRTSAEQCQSYVSSVIYDDVTYDFTTWFDTHYRVFAKK